ncbi:hypothetical protein H0H92_003492 [Tricholoma furcatifolium]|nr:hypothetical protein H0H92_003492 [Tricholoma furcatifolium]
MLWDLSKEHPKRTPEGSKELYYRALQARTKDERNRILKTQGLRLIENAWWDMGPLYDPYAAYSFDELHNNDHGVEGKHIFPEIIRVIKSMPSKQRREAAHIVGEQMASLPPWPKLKSFKKNFMTTKFADGNHFRAIMKTPFTNNLQLIVFVTHNVLACDVKSNTYKLLYATRKYLDMTTWQMLEVATDDTISAGKLAVLAFGDAMNAYASTLTKLAGTGTPQQSNKDNIAAPSGCNTESSDDNDDNSDDDDNGSGDDRRLDSHREDDYKDSDESSDDDESDDDGDDEEDDASSEDSDDEGAIDNQDTEDDFWKDVDLRPPTQSKFTNYPKFHLQSHAFEDIKAKGVLRGYSTRHFEGRHCSYKESYQNSTNFKEYTDQILLDDMINLSMHMIREDIDANAEYIKKQANEEVKRQKLVNFGNIYLGSPEKVVSFHTLEHKYKDDPAFKNLYRRCLLVLRDILQRDSSPIKIADFNVFKQSIGTEDKIIAQFKYIKVTFESAVSGFAETNKIRCNPSCYGKERFDCVLVHSYPRNAFYRLVFTFVVKLKANPSDQKASVPIALALAVPFKEVNRTSATELQRNRDLRLLRLKQMPREKAQIIPLRSIIRGAYIIPEGKDLETSLIVDIIDSDMFLRMQEMYPP